MAKTHPFARLLALFSPRKVDREAEQLRDGRECEGSKNDDVAKILREQGDTLEQSRPVQHWAYFPTEQSRSQFIAFVAQRFSTIDPHMNPMSEGKNYAVTFWHTGCPDADSMTEITKMLSLAAASCGGEYDGWETQVVA